VKGFWKQLLWLGPDNWGGLTETLVEKQNPKEDVENEAQKADVGDDSGDDNEGVKSAFKQAKSHSRPIQSAQHDEFAFLDSINEDVERRGDGDGDEDVDVNYDDGNDYDESHNTPGGVDEGQGSDVDEYGLQTHWNIGRYLTPAAADYFHYIIGQPIIIIIFFSICMLL